MGDFYALARPQRKSYPRLFSNFSLHLIFSTGMALSSTAESTFPQLRRPAVDKRGTAAGGVPSDRSHPGKAKGPRKYELQGPFC